MEKKIPSRIKRKRNIKFKKSTIGIFVGIFAFVFAMFHAFAGENNKLIVDKIESASRGDEVTVNVAIECNKDYNAGGFYVNFDPDVLEYVDAELTGSINPSASSKDRLKISDLSDDSEVDEGKYYVGFIPKTENVAACESMDSFVEFTFEVKADAAGGSSPITITQAVMVKEIDGVREDLTVDTENGYVVVALPVDMDSVALQKSNYEIQKGATDTLTVVYEPENTTDEANTTYVSSNPSIVSVDANGTMTANAVGETTITVTAFGKELTANVSVVNHITGVTITGTKSEIAKEEELQLSVEITPADTSDDKTLTWESSAPTIASVDQTGKVTGLAGGEAIITAKSTNNVTGTYTINVVVPMTSFTTEDDEITLNKGETHDVVTSILPGDTTESKTITWATDNSAVATVNNGTISAVGAGTATITGTLPNERSITVNVTVVVPLESISVDKSNVELLPTQSQEIELTINPSDTTDTNPVVWESNATSVATVDNGVITAVAPGDATITVTKGSKSKTISVHVLVPIENFTISEPSVTLNRNETHKLTVTITPNEAEEDKTVTWTSSDSTSVSVTDDGTITGLKGTQEPVTITGTLANGKKVTCSVTVVVLINDISLNKTETTINKGKTEKLLVTIDPTDTSESTDVTWESGDPTIATVASDGTVTGVKAGTTTISATVGSHTKTCSVTIVVPLESVSITESNFTLNRGDDKTLHATVSPEDTTDEYTITWSSNKTSVATVDANGKVIAVGAGKATITATANGKTDTVEVTVNVPITGFTVNKEDLELVKGKSETLQTTITPNDTTEETTITWSSNKTNIATVDDNGKVTAVAEGTAVITGELENGMTVTTNVTVTIIPVTKITVSKKTLDIKKNETETLSVTYEPEDATEVTNVTYTSSDPTVATVDEDGTVTGIKEGTATITATMGSLTDTCDVTVTEVPFEDISLDDNTTNHEVGKSFKLDVDDLGTTDDVTYTYESSDESIATIAADGTVTPKKAGKLSITVTATNGTTTVTKTIELNITAPASSSTGITPAWIYGIIITILLSTALVICKKKELF